LWTAEDEHSVPGRGGLQPPRLPRLREVRLPAVRPALGRGAVRLGGYLPEAGVPAASLPLPVGFRPGASPGDRHGPPARRVGAAAARVGPAARRGAGGKLALGLETSLFWAWLHAPVTVLGVRLLACAIVLPVLYRALGDPGQGWTGDVP